MAMGHIFQSSKSRGKNLAKEVESCCKFGSDIELVKSATMAHHSAGKAGRAEAALGGATGGGRGRAAAGLTKAGGAPESAGGQPGQTAGKQLNQLLSVRPVADEVLRKSWLCLML